MKRQVFTYFHEQYGSYFIHFEFLKGSLCISRNKCRKNCTFLFIAVLYAVDI